MSSSDRQFPSLDDYTGFFSTDGGYELPYLRQHFPRYLDTKRRLLANKSLPDDTRVLDVGAHWLHQTLLYAIEGFEVTALDLPATFDLPMVRALAQAHRIRLLSNRDLEHPNALDDVPEDTFDFVLFTEVIEHLAFNPVEMWCQIYRVMKPGGRIVVTTPNFYGLRQSVRRWMRALAGKGGGISVTDILTLKTLGHHWKEFSMDELREYFRTLSPDFVLRNPSYCESTHESGRLRTRGKIANWIERMVPPLRAGLYAEIELTSKSAGICVDPHW